MSNMQKLSPQKEYILSFLRKGGWVCGRAWLDCVKDDRKRIGELSEYMASKGFKIIGDPCKGTACGNPKCPLFKRKAVKLSQAATPTPQRSPIPAAALQSHQHMMALWENTPA